MQQLTISSHEAVYKYIIHSNRRKTKCTYWLSVVDRIVTRIPLKSDGASDGRSTSDACEFVYVDVYDTGISSVPLRMVIRWVGFDKLKNSTLNCFTLLSLLVMTLLSELTPAGWNVNMIV